MLDDGVNDAWYKSECGQACGFGGEKFKWLVRMVLLHPFIPRATLLLSISLPNPEKPVQQSSHLSHLRRTNFVRPQQDIKSTLCWFFRLIFINIKARPDNNVVAGCWSRGEHLLRDRVQVRSRSSDHANKTVEEHTFT